jgi:heat shock protein HslJ
MDPSVRRALASLVITSALGGCKAMPPSPDLPELSGTAWALSSLSGHAPIAGTVVTLRFDGGRVEGTDGCNRYTAPYTVVGPVLQVASNAATTRMACPPEIARQAEAYVGALAQARSYRIAGGELQLFAAAGMVLATLAAQSQGLAGTSWRVTGYNNGRQAVVSVLVGAEPTMAFGTDGRVGGSTGCNRYGATYVHSGSKLSLGPAAATRKRCVDPERIMEQEQQFLQALQTVASVRIDGDRLELRTGEGALAATLLREPAPK